MTNSLRAATSIYLVNILSSYSSVTFFPYINLIGSDFLNLRMSMSWLCAAIIGSVIGKLILPLSSFAIWSPCVAIFCFFNLDGASVSEPSTSLPQFGPGDDKMLIGRQAAEPRANSDGAKRCVGDTELLMLRAA